MLIMVYGMWVKWSTIHGPFYKSYSFKTLLSVLIVAAFSSLNQIILATCQAVIIKLIHSAHVHSFSSHSPLLLIGIACVHLWLHPGTQVEEPPTKGQFRKQRFNILYSEAKVVRLIILGVLTMHDSSKIVISCRWGTDEAYLQQGQAGWSRNKEVHETDCISCRPPSQSRDYTQVHTVRTAL